MRASAAQVGNDADPYQLLSTYRGTNPISGQPQFTFQDNISNPDLKPEKTTAKELGLELSLLDGRATFDFSVYNKATRNQIFTIPVSPASGFFAKAVNAGEITNKESISSSALRRCSWRMASSGRLPSTTLTTRAW